LLARCLVV